MQNPFSNYKHLNEFLEQFQRHNSGSYPHNYFYFTDSTLLEFLKSLGMDKFHVSNKSFNRVYLHQIISYLFCGGIQAFANGLTCDKEFVEIHHIDSNTFNNHPANLVYVTVELHDVIHKHSRAIKKYLKRFNKRDSILQYKIVWNRKGQLISLVRFIDWAFNILLQTMIRTAKDNQITLYLHNLGKWMFSVINRWKVNVCSSHVPTFILQPDLIVN